MVQTLQGFCHYHQKGNNKNKAFTEKPRTKIEEGVLQRTYIANQCIKQMSDDPNMTLFKSIFKL